MSALRTGTVPDHVDAAVMSGPGAIEVRRFPYPGPEWAGPVVRVVAAGICGTDKHTYRGERSQYAGTAHARQVPYPVIPGHEIVAVVDDPAGQGLEADSEGMPLAPGDRVIVAPDVACGKCYFCRGSFPYYYCENLQDYGNSLSCARPPYLFGGWAEHMCLLPRTKVFRVPDNISSEVAALTEEMAVTHGLDTARCIGALRGGDVFAESVVVMGVGPLGMCHCIKAQAIGAGPVIAIDISPSRLEAAAGIVGASLIVDAARLSRAERRQVVYEATYGRGADIVIDCTGSMSTLAEAVDLARQGGVVVEAGAFVDLGQSADFRPAAVCTKEIAVLGVGGERSEHYSAALRVLCTASKQMDLSRLVAQRFGLQEVGAAIETALGQSSLKVLIVPEPEA